MKKSLLFLLIAGLFFSCKKEEYKTLSLVDANGYKYETVTNDPFKVRIYTLDNGLKVYLSKNQDEPKVQTFIGVRVGSKNDPRDNTGLAHYFEHMMFKGTTHFGTIDWEGEQPLIEEIADLYEQHKAAQTPEEKASIYKKIDAVSHAASRYAIPNEYDHIVSAIGATGTNAFTGTDYTAYLNDIPANELEKYLQVEADRFNNLVLRLFQTELETVYEEFNMYQDQTNTLIMEKLFAAVFQKHPYQVSVIGLPQHLKNPSMKSVMEFYKTYYVPNNIAICMAGDLDFEKTIQLIDKYFGNMQPNDQLPVFEPPVEEPIKEAKHQEMFTPDSEFLITGYRSQGVKSEDERYLNMIAAILYNGKAGLIDSDLIQKQKVLWADTYFYSLKDYGLFCVYAAPRDGQTLEELESILQEEIEKLKKGDFNEDLLEAIINNKKLELVKKTDNRKDTASEMFEVFANGLTWAEYLAKIEAMSQLTKKDVVKFANRFFNDNYVTIYKRVGENKDKVKVEKPNITPVEINRNQQSEFAAELLAQPSEPIQPVFVDFKEKIKQQTIREGVDFYYLKNESNPLYELNNIVNISNITDKKLALAFEYLPYLGTANYSPEQLQLEIYKLGMTFDTHSTAEQTFITLSGLNETMDRSIALMEEMLQHSIVNEEAYQNLVNDIIKERMNLKIDRNTILRNGLVSYAKYGTQSPFTDILTEEELKAIDPQELVDLIKQFTTYKQSYFYYGPQSNEDMVAKIEKIQHSDGMTDTPAKKIYPELPMDKPSVYFANYDMVQTEVVLLAKDVLFDPSLFPYQTMFNAYYGSGINSIIFQEIREARGLAYTAFARVAPPRTARESNYIQGYVGTQSDKMKTALDAFRSLLSQMPQAEQQFELSKEAVLNMIRSERITKSNMFWKYMQWKELGVDYDIRKPLFETIESMKIEDIEHYFETHIKPATYSILIIGKKENIDFNYLREHYGEVQEVSLETVFGY